MACFYGAPVDERSPEGLSRLCGMVATSSAASLADADSSGTRELWRKLYDNTRTRKKNKAGLDRVCTALDAITKEIDIIGALQVSVHSSSPDLQALCARQEELCAHMQRVRTEHQQLTYQKQELLLWSVWLQRALRSDLSAENQRRRERWLLAALTLDVDNMGDDDFEESDGAQRSVWRALSAFFFPVHDEAAQHVHVFVPAVLQSAPPVPPDTWQGMSASGRARASCDGGSSATGRALLRSESIGAA